MVLTIVLLDKRRKRLRSGKILFGSQTGTCRKLAYLLRQASTRTHTRFQVVDLKDYEVDDLFDEELILIVISTHENGTPPTTSQWFYNWLEDASNDFRFGNNALKNLKFSVFGCGNSVYEDKFNFVGIKINAFLSKLGAVKIAPIGLGDENESNIETEFTHWCSRVFSGLNGGAEIHVKTPQPASQELDIEDLVSKAPTRSQSPTGGAIKDMLTPLLRTSLTKQGYKLIGSHSGVKMCRWTKSMLRGRGGCYKHTFYGIESHRCMEMTPSLACANKCVFCWRHHTNPVGKQWKWNQDSPQEIVKSALNHHTKMIKEYSGVPGVQPQKLKEGFEVSHFLICVRFVFQVKHCALSLVGEPIMYPEINTLVHELHSRKISTFLVTNAQFPEKIEELTPVTQLYVSVDAATKDSLKSIDRPLFEDFWQRFRDCLVLLRQKKQRTVYRLTLVKDWNMQEISNYAELIELGKPDFVEIKGVTYCGDSNTSKLTMKNVPYHEDVCAFGEALSNQTQGSYGLACEHAHSCCILLARKDRFFRTGHWWTWIDYDQFLKLQEEGNEFSSEDYLLPTPSWAVYGSSEEGFDPQETKFKKQRNHK
eukprot:g5520.t1